MLSCQVKIYDLHTKRAFISYVYAALLHVVIDEWEKINVPHKEEILADVEATADFPGS